MEIGDSPTPPIAVKLFKPCAERLILTTEFRVYRVSKGQLFPPSRLGDTPAQIEAYELVDRITVNHEWADLEVHLVRMKLLQPDAPPPLLERVTPTLRWMCDPFVNLHIGRRTVAVGTH